MAKKIGMVQRRVIDLMRTLPDNMITPTKLSESPVGVFRNWTACKARKILEEMTRSGMVQKEERGKYYLDKSML